MDEIRSALVDSNCMRSFNASSSTREFATCRGRKVKCDGAIPTCQNCMKSNRICERPAQTTKFIIQTTGSNSVVEVTSSNSETATETGKFRAEVVNARDSVASSPRSALESPVIAALFRHYIDVLAPWYDLNDSYNSFGTVVPIHALENAVLFKALIAFSACHKERVSGILDGIGTTYHAECVHDLLAVMNDLNPEVQGIYLAATCLLRSYEILNGNTRQQQHLLGAYSFATGGTVDLNVRGLYQAGIWNYLREEITMALECRRSVRFSDELQFEPRASMSDDMWANAISHILARIINFCFPESPDIHDVEIRRRVWTNLSAEVQVWRNALPASLSPFSTAPKQGNPFPSIWIVQQCHVAGEQYCCITEILLALSEPISTAEHFGIKGREVNAGAVEAASLKICGLAYTNDNVAARVNAFGPLAFCGRYLTKGRHQDALIDMLREFSIPTGWPIDPIIQDLKLCWSYSAASFRTNSN